MRKLLVSLALPAAIALVGVADAAPANLAAPAPGADTARASGDIVQARHERHWRHGHRWHRHHYGYYGRRYYHYPRYYYPRRYYDPGYSYAPYYHRRPRFNLHIGF